MAHCYHHYLLGVGDINFMIDRRTLLKRMGIMGLSIPAAMIVEKKLVIPAEERQKILSARPDYFQGVVDQTIPGLILNNTYLYVNRIEIEQNHGYNVFADITRKQEYMKGARVRLLLEGWGEEMMISTVPGRGIRPSSVVCVDRISL